MKSLFYSLASRYSDRFNTWKDISIRAEKIVYPKINENDFSIIRAGFLECCFLDLRVQDFISQDIFKDKDKNKDNLDYNLLILEFITFKTLLATHTYEQFRQMNKSIKSKINKKPMEDVHKKAPIFFDILEDLKWIRVALVKHETAKKRKEKEYPVSFEFDTKLGFSFFNSGTKCWIDKDMSNVIDLILKQYWLSELEYLSASYLSSMPSESLT